MSSINEFTTYLNRNGYPILRRCRNCVNWKADANHNQNGFCKKLPMYFAFTLKKTAYASTKDFYLCENHTFIDEERLKELCDTVYLKDAIKSKEEL
jgi:hypothetical protein